MKAAHLEKIAKRADRALRLLLPWEDNRGQEVEDPKERLREIIKRIDGGGGHNELRNDIWALTELLETDVPAMIQAVRDAQAAEDKARKELNHLAMERAGRRYQVTVFSDAPIKVTGVTEATE